MILEYQYIDFHLSPLRSWRQTKQKECFWAIRYNLLGQIAQQKLADIFSEWDVYCIISSNKICVWFLYLATKSQHSTSTSKSTHVLVSEGGWVPRDAARAASHPPLSSDLPLSFKHLLYKLGIGFKFSREIFLSNNSELHRK